MPVRTTRRACLVVLPAVLPAVLSAMLPEWAGAPPAWQQAMQRARELRDQAVRDGDQPYGAVLLRGDSIVGEAPSRVITTADPTAHAEMEAIRDAARRLGNRDLSGCVLVSTSRPCRMCEAAAAWARVSRMVYGDALTDGGAPS